MWPASRCLSTTGLHNVINKPTRVTFSSETCIDTIFTNSISVMDDISDHLPIFCISDISLKRTQIPIREKRKVNKKTIVHLMCLLSKQNWKGITDLTDPNESYNEFLNLFIDCYNKSMPIVKCRRKTLNLKPVEKRTNYTVNS